MELICSGSMDSVLNCAIISRTGRFLSLTASCTPLLPEEGWREAPGWWEASPYPSTFISYTVASRRPVTFFAPPKKVTKERGSPVRRHYLVTSCGVPALLGGEQGHQRR